MAKTQRTKPPARTQPSRKPLARTQPNRKTPTIAGWSGAASARGTYGLILVMSLLAVWASEAHPHAREVLASVVATTFVFWIAHVYSEVIAVRIREGRDLVRNERRAIARQELPLIEVSIPPILLLVLAWAGAIRVTTAIDTSLYLCLAGLGILGFYSAHSAGTRGLRLLVATAISVALGLIVVGLKTQID